MDIQGAAELAALWQQAPDIVRAELLAATTEADGLLEREIQERTPTGIGGALRTSIKGQETVLADSVIGVVGTPLSYAVPVELGTRPHFPWPIEPLKDWVRHKLDVPPEEVDEVAFLIARKIAARGTEGAHMFSGAFEANRVQITGMYERARDRIVERLADI
jgi:hypothetical protein